MTNYQNIPVALLQKKRSHANWVTLLFYCKVRVYTRYRRGFFKMDQQFFDAVGMKKRSCLKQLKNGLQQGYFHLRSGSKDVFVSRCIYTVMADQCQWTQSINKVKCIQFSDKLVLESEPNNMIDFKLRAVESITEQLKKKIFSDQVPPKYDEQGMRIPKHKRKLYLNVASRPDNLGSRSFRASASGFSESTIKKYDSKGTCPEIRYCWKEQMITRRYQDNAVMGYEFALLLNELTQSGKPSRNAYMDRIVQHNNYWGYYFYHVDSGEVRYSPPSTRLSSLELSRCNVPKKTKEWLSARVCL